jgi:thiamine transporter ThiT
MKNVRIIVLSAIFGALAILCTNLWIPMFFGNPNLGSVPVILAAVLCPIQVGVVAGIVKGVGASLWTGQALIEMPAGIGDALMAAFANYLASRWKRVYAVIAGQLSRYLFTSGMIALNVGFISSFGVSEATFRSLLRGPPWFMPSLSSLPPLVANIIIVWIAIFPAITLSIVGNMLISTLVITAAGKRLEELLK